MAFGVTYELTTTNLIGQTVKFQIEEDGGSGATALTAQHEALQVTFDTPADDIFAPINGSRLVVRLMGLTNFVFRPLYTSNPLKYRGTLRIDGDVIWRGFMVPEQGRYEYQQAPNRYVFVFTDRLGYLKSVKWDRADEPVETELAMLGAILQQTGQEFGMYEAINVYDDAHNNDPEDSPLAQTYVDPSRFEGKTYYDALYHLLRKYNAVIKQWERRWEIIRPQDCNDPYTRRYYSYSGGIFTYSDVEEDYDPVVDTTSANPVGGMADLVRVAADNPYIETSPAWRRYNLKRDLGLRDSVFENGEFTLHNDNDTNMGVAHWYNSENTTDVHLVDDGILVHSDGSSGWGHGENTGYIYQRINAVGLYKIWHKRVKFRVEWDVYVAEGESMHLMIDVLREDPATGQVWYGGRDGRSWSLIQLGHHEGYDHVEEDLFESGTFEWFDEGDYWKSSEWMEVRLWHPSGGDTESYVRWKRVVVEFMDSSDEEEAISYTDIVEEEVIVQDNALKDGGTVQLWLSDLPTLTHPIVYGLDTGWVYRGGLWNDLEQSDQTTNWTSPQGEGTLADLVKAGLAWFYTNQTEILRASIYTTKLKSTSVIKEINYENRLFLIKRVVWDVRYCRWMVTAYNIGQDEESYDSAEVLRAADGTPLLAADGTPLLPA